MKQKKKAKLRIKPLPTPCSCGSISISHHQLKMGNNSAGDLITWSYSGCSKCNLPKGKVTMRNLTKERSRA